MSRKNMGVIVLAVIILAFGSFVIFHHPSSSSSSNTQASEQTQAITYQGVDGKTALDILKTTHQVETTHSDIGDYVNSIDGVTPDSNHFWSFYVNGSLSTVGASSYQTKSSDVIMWKVDSIQ